jgi:outer membrane protein W
MSVRKFWGKKIQPYVGGGLALIQLNAKQIESGTLGVPGTEFSIVNVDDDDSAVGIWINAGLLYRINSRFHVGVDLRQSDAEADLSPELSSSDLTVDSGGTHVGVVLGYHW